MQPSLENFLHSLITLSNLVYAYISCLVAFVIFRFAIFLNSVAFKSMSFSKFTIVDLYRKVYGVLVGKTMGCNPEIG